MIKKLLLAIAVTSALCCSTAFAETWTVVGSKDVSWYPKNMRVEGRFVRIDIDEKVDLPVIFAVDPSGQLMLVNDRYDRGSIRVPDEFDHLRLKLGEQAIDLYRDGRHITVFKSLAAAKPGTTQRAALYGAARGRDLPRT